MKRFLIIIMIVIMLMLLCSATLVGCADVNLPTGGGNQENNKPVVPDPVEPDDSGEYIQSSLSEFLELWFESKNKSFYMAHSGVRGVLNDNIAMVTETMDHSYCNIYEYEGRNVNIYRGSGETSDKTLEWNYTKKVLDESTDAEYFDIVNYFNDLMKHSADWQEWWIFSDEFFEENFVQDEEGFYVGQEVLIGVKIGFTGTEMRLISPGYPEFEYTEVYTIGSDKIVIPEEAKDAMQTEINKAKSPAEFIQRWLDGGNKTFYIQDGNGVGTLYENMFMMTDGENTYSIYEYVDGKINHYTTTQNGWEAKVYTVEEMEEQMGVTFEGIQTLLIYFDYGKIEEILKITEEVFISNFEQENDWFVGKGDYEKEKYLITGKELTVKYDYDYLTTEYDAKYVMGAKPIIIPDEAKEALKKAQAQA